MHQDGAGRCCGADEGANRERVDRQHSLGLVFCAVHAVVDRTVDDQIRSVLLHHPPHGVVVSDVERLAIKRNDVVSTRRRAEFPDDRAADKAAAAGDQNTHYPSSASASVATTACCCSSVSSP